MTSTITARRLLSAKGVIDFPIVHLDDGYIKSISNREQAELPVRDLSIHSFPDALLAPAYLDIHVHGAVGHDVMDVKPEALSAIESFLASHGVGGFFPTTVSSPVESTLRALDFLAQEIERGTYEGAVPLGIHLEGPFISSVKRGAHYADYILQPSIPLFDRFWEAARGHISLMTIAPELSNAVELIEYATSKGIICSLGHSDATAQEAKAGCCAGARSATHTFNAMRNLSNRELGVVECVLDEDALSAEIICDGIHVDPALVRLFFKAKGPDRSILVTDGAAPMGLPEGRHTIGNRKLEVKNGLCTSDGVLAGSICAMDRAVMNFSNFTESDLPTSLRLATMNPAKLMNLDNEWGLLEKGREANILALSSTGEIQQVFRAGRPLL